MGALIDSSHFRLPLVQIASSRVRDSLANTCLNGAIEKSSSSDLKVRVFKEFRKSNCDNIMCESEGQTEEQRVKFLCSFGGSILPRPSDGKLRYVGGETRIVCVNRDISYSELMFKMTEFYDQALTLKYQLPEEDLDALVSVLCDDDLANMMDEYDKLEATDGFTRLRVFLFSAVEYDVSPLHEETDPEQRYVDALNRVPENGESRRPSEISVFGPAESFDSFNCAVADNGSVQRGQAPGNAQHVVTALPISPKQPLFHIASPPRSPLKHHPHPASALNQHRQPAIHLGEPDQYYQEQSWESGSHVHVQDFICLASTGLSVMPLQEPYQDSVTVTDFTYKAQSEVMHPEIHHGVLLNQMHKQSVEVYASNDEYCGNLQQVDRQEDIPPFIEVSDRCWEEKPIPDILSLQVHMHQLNLLEQPHMHPVYQAVGHCPGEVLEDQEFIPQGKPVLHPMESSRVYDGLEWKQEQCPLGDDEIETSWHAPYYASGLPISPEFSLSSQSAPASDFCLRSTAPTSRIKLSDEHEMYLESQPHIQVIWAPNCGIPEANYESRADHGSNQWSGQAAPLTSHPNSSNYLPTEKHVRWHHQPPFIGEEPRLKGQNVNHLEDTFEGSSASKCLYASIKLRENLSEVTGLKTYVEHVPAYPNQHGSSGIESQILESGSEYHPMMVEELSRQNASAKVDQLEYSTEHMRSCTSYEDTIDRAVGCDLHQRNGDGEEFKNSLAERAPGVVAVEEGMNKDARKSHYLEHNSRRYYGLPDESYDPSLHSELYMHASSSQFELCTHVPLPVDLQTGCRNFDSMISRYDFRQGLKASGFADSPHNNMQQKVTGTRLDHASVFPLEPTDEENPWSYSSADKRNQEINLAQNDGKKVERLHGFYTSHEINAADVCSVPAYMLDDVFPKRIENTFGYEGNLPKEFLQDMGSKFIKEIEDINAPFVPPYFQMHPQRGIHAEWTPDAFVTLRSNDIPSSSAYSCAITSSRVILPDSLTFSSSTGVLPSLSSSHPTSNILTTTILPIYDQSPASSANITVPEDLWSENDRQKQFNESKESEAKAAGTAQLVEDLISHKGVARQDQDLDNKMLDNCLNDRPEVGIHSTFRYMDSPVHSCGPLCSSITPTSKIEGKQASTGSAEKTIYEEVKAEAKSHRSDAEEGLMEEKVPEGHSLGFGEDSQCTSVNMAKNDSSVSETEILAQGLQIVRNDDLEEIRELGSGTYGTVYYGKWKGSDVAIKRIKASCFTGSQSERERMIADFWREARILGQLHHPNVVAFYGIVRDGPGGTLATVTEYMVNGSLKQVLHKKDRTIDRRKRLIIAMDAAFGMEYLHGKNIVHFDLKCDNLLVNMRDPHRPVCKIGDLGLSKVKQRTLVSGGVRGTLPWMAPELLSGKSGMVTDKIDVYSFGIVMWELLTGDEPYANMHCGEIIGGILSNTLRPSIPSWCDPAWRSLMEKCWASDPGQRPSFSDIAKELRAIAASINLK